MCITWMLCIMGRNEIILRNGLCEVIDFMLRYSLHKWLCDTSFLWHHVYCCIGFFLIAFVWGFHQNEWRKKLCWLEWSVMSHEFWIKFWDFFIYCFSVCVLSIMIILFTFYVGVSRRCFSIGNSLRRLKNSYTHEMN